MSERQDSSWMTPARGARALGVSLPQPEPTTTRSGALARRAVAGVERERVGPERVLPHGAAFEPLQQRGLPGRAGAAPVEGEGPRGAAVGPELGAPRAREDEILLNRRDSPLEGREPAAGGGPRASGAAQVVSCPSTRRAAGSRPLPARAPLDNDRGEGVGRGQQNVWNTGGERARERGRGGLRRRGRLQRRRNNKGTSFRPACQPAGERGENRPRCV